MCLVHQLKAQRSQQQGREMQPTARALLGLGPNLGEVKLGCSCLSPQERIQAAISLAQKGVLQGWGTMKAWGS